MSQTIICNIIVYWFNRIKCEHNGCSGNSISTWWRTYKYSPVQPGDGIHLDFVILGFVLWYCELMNGTWNQLQSDITLNANKTNFAETHVFLIFLLSTFSTKYYTIYIVTLSSLNRTIITNTLTYSSFAFPFHCTHKPAAGFPLVFPAKHYSCPTFMNMSVSCRTQHVQCHTNS